MYILAKVALSFKIFNRSLSSVLCWIQNLKYMTKFKLKETNCMKNEEFPGLY